MMESVMPFLLNEKLNRHFYALVDGALLSGFYANLAQIDKLRYKSLFSSTMDADAAVVGPILLELIPDSHKTLIDELITVQANQPTPIWLQTEVKFTPLFNTLRKMLYGEKEDGSQQLLRYYDTSCLPGFLPIAYKNPYYAGVMRKIYWAVWQQEDKEYQYYDKDKPGGMT